MFNSIITHYHLHFCFRIIQEIVGSQNTKKEAIYRISAFFLFKLNSLYRGNAGNEHRRNYSGQEHQNDHRYIEYQHRKYIYMHRHIFQIIYTRIKFEEVCSSLKEIKYERDRIAYNQSVPYYI